MSDIEQPVTCEILEQSIKLEQGFGKLYKLFSDYYVKDEQFWLRMSQDEEKHATTLASIRPWVSMGIDGEQFLLADLQELIDKNIAIKKIIQRAKDEKPTRETAFNLAYKIELTASEVHYQKMITGESDNKLRAAMQNLCRADKNHQKLIRTMMETLNIEIQ